MSLLQHPHFRPSHYLGGSAASFFSLFYSMDFHFLHVFSVGSDYALSDFLQDDYLHQVIAFSVGQAFLSALLSSVIGTLFATRFFLFRFQRQIAHFTHFFSHVCFAGITGYFRFDWYLWHGRVG